MHKIVTGFLPITFKFFKFLFISRCKCWYYLTYQLTYQQIANIVRCISWAVMYTSFFFSLCLTETNISLTNFQTSCANPTRVLCVFRKNAQWWDWMQEVGTQKFHRLTLLNAFVGRRIFKSDMQTDLLMFMTHSLLIVLFFALANEINWLPLCLENSVTFVNHP